MTLARTVQDAVFAQRVPTPEQAALCALVAELAINIRTIARCELRQCIDAKFNSDRYMPIFGWAKQHQLAAAEQLPFDEQVKAAFGF